MGWSGGSYPFQVFVAVYHLQDDVCSHSITIKLLVETCQPEKRSAVLLDFSRKGRSTLLIIITFTAPSKNTNLFL